jgi:hypothetical protein
LIDEATFLRVNPEVKRELVPGEELLSANFTFVGRNHEIARIGDDARLGRLLAGRSEKNEIILNILGINRIEKEHFVADHEIVAFVKQEFASNFAKTSLNVTD